VKSSDAAELTTASFILPKEPIATATEAVVKSVSVEDNTIDIDSVVEPKKINEAQKEEAEVEETVENDEEGSGDSVKVEKTTENQIIVTTTTSSPVTETVQATTAAAVEANIQPDATASPWERLTRVQQEEFNRKYLALRPELQEYSRNQFLSLPPERQEHAYAAFLSADLETLSRAIDREFRRERLAIQQQQQVEQYTRQQQQQQQILEQERQREVERLLEEKEKNRNEAARKEAHRIKEVELKRKAEQEAQKLREAQKLIEAQKQKETERLKEASKLRQAEKQAEKQKEAQEKKQKLETKLLKLIEPDELIAKAVKNENESVFLPGSRSAAPARVSELPRSQTGSRLAPTNNRVLTRLNEIPDRAPRRRPVSRRPGPRGGQERERRRQQQRDNIRRLMFDPRRKPRVRA